MPLDQNVKMPYTYASAAAFVNVFGTGVAMAREKAQ